MSVRGTGDNNPIFREWNETAKKLDETTKKLKDERTAEQNKKSEAVKKPGEVSPLESRAVTTSEKPTTSRAKQALETLEAAGSELYDFLASMVEGFVALLARLITNQKKFSAEFNNAFFHEMLNNTVILSGNLEFDASNAIEKLLDEEIKENRNPNKLEFKDNDDNTFSLELNNLDPYPDDPDQKKACITEFMKSVKEFYVREYGESAADEKMRLFSKKILSPSLEHFKIDGIDVDISTYLEKDLNRQKYFMVNENGENVLLVDFEKDPCPDKAADRKTWMAARIKSLMEYCGYKKDGDPKANKIALKNLMILSSVAHQGIMNSYQRTVIRDSNETGPQHLENDIPFTIPAKAIAAECIISREDDGSLLIRNICHIDEKESFAQVMSAESQVIDIEGKDSFWDVDVGIRLVPNANGELVPQEYTDGWIDYRIVEK